MHAENRQRQIIGLVLWLALVFVVATFGGLASRDAPSFYSELVRPDWAPPAWLFGPVWTVLYTAMGVAAWLVWRREGFGSGRRALTLFLIQLVFNALWSWLFFAWRLGGPAFADIAVLWALVLATCLAFWRHNRLAGAMLIPYLLWVSFAGALNLALWRMNPQAL